MTDYPRRERQNSPTTPAPVSKAESAHEATDDKPKPKVPVRIVQAGRDALSGVQRVEEIEAEPDAAQDWDDTIWNNGMTGPTSQYGR